MKITLTDEILSKYLDTSFNLKHNAKWLPKIKEELRAIDAEVDCIFENGNAVLRFEDPWDWFIVVSTEGEVLNLFQAYEASNCMYSKRVDAFLIPGHETVHLVFSDGTFEKVNTR